VFTFRGLRIIYQFNDGYWLGAPKIIVRAIGRKGVKVLVECLLECPRTYIKECETEASITDIMVTEINEMKIRTEFVVIKGLINISWIWYFNSLDEFKCVAKILFSRELNRVNNELAKTKSKLVYYERKYNMGSKRFIKLMDDWFDGRVERLPPQLEVESREENSELTKWWNLYDNYRKLTRTRKVIVKALNNLR